MIICLVMILTILYMDLIMLTNILNFHLLQLDRIQFISIPLMPFHIFQFYYTTVGLIYSLLIRLLLIIQLLLIILKLKYQYNFLIHPYLYTYVLIDYNYCCTIIPFYYFKYKPNVAHFCSSSNLYKHDCESSISLNRNIYCVNVGIHIVCLCFFCLSKGKINIDTVFVY